nr:MAG TPA: hypothetical protein [Caudoviricetes sp.]
MSADPSRETGEILPPPAASPNQVRTKSGLSPDSGPHVRGIKENSLGSGRVGSGSNRVETGQRPGRADTGSGRDRAGEAQPSPHGKSRRRRKRK